MILTVLLGSAIIILTFVSIVHYVKRDIFQPIVYILALYFGIGVIARGVQLMLEPNLFQNFSLLPVPFSLIGLNWALLNILICEMALLIGYYIGLNLKRGFFDYIMIYHSYFENKINNKKQYILILNVITIFVLAFSMYLGLHHIVGAFGIRTYQSYSFLLSESISLTAFFLFLLYSFKISQNKKVGFLFYVLFLAYLIFQIMIGGMKGSILLVLQLFVIFYYLKMFNKTSVKKVLSYLSILLVIFLVLLFFVLYPFINSYRNAAVKYALTGEKINYGKVIENMSMFTSFNYFINTLLNRFSYFDEAYLVVNEPQSNINAYRKVVPPIQEMLIYGLIPRFIWPNKPTLTTGLFVTQILVGSKIFTATAIGFVGSAYAEGGGIIGVFIWSLLVGIIFGLIYKILIRKRSNWTFVAIYAFLYLSMGLITEGNIGSTLLGIFYNFNLTYFVSLILIIFFIKSIKLQILPKRGGKNEV
ncbi:MAG: O-antigen polymerase [Thermoplasmata archaeon]